MSTANEIIPSASSPLLQSLLGVTVAELTLNTFEDPGTIAGNSFVQLPSDNVKVYVPGDNSEKGNSLRITSLELFLS